MSSIDGSSTSHIIQHLRYQQEAIRDTVDARQLETAVVEANTRNFKEKVQATLDPEISRIFNLYADSYIDLYV